ncbi:MAG: hypothetical protein HQL28_04550 [Candidatus Omnitrophica bacterium]|nr:hypothetical protein [Candidatus Omnitrophota bacterium]
MVKKRDETNAVKVDVALFCRIENVLRSSENIVFILTSPDDIAGVLTAYKVSLKSGRIFVIDIDTAYALDKRRKTSKNIPEFDWRNVRIRFTPDQADAFSANVSSKLLYHYNSGKINIFEINKKKEHILVLLREETDLPDIVKDVRGVSGACVICTARVDNLTDKFKNYCTAKGIRVERLVPLDPVAAEGKENAGNP